MRASSRPLGLLAGIAVLLAILTMERPDGLSAQGQSALAVFGLCVIYWVTRVVPLMVTSLMVLVLLPATGALTQNPSSPFLVNNPAGVTSSIVAND